MHFILTYICSTTSHRLWLQLPSSTPASCPRAVTTTTTTTSSLIPPPLPNRADSSPLPKSGVCAKWTRARNEPALPSPTPTAMRRHLRSVGVRKAHPTSMTPIPMKPSTWPRSSDQWAGRGGPRSLAIITNGPVGRIGRCGMRSQLRTSTRRCVYFLVYSSSRYSFTVLARPHQEAHRVWILPSGG